MVYFSADDTSATKEEMVRELYDDLTTLEERGAEEDVDETEDIEQMNSVLDGLYALEEEE